MVGLKFNVKDNGLQEFFKNYGVVDKQPRRCGETDNPYYLLKDVLFLKKTAPIPPGTSVTLELSDVSSYSRKYLLNKYEYEVDHYDDVVYRLTLKKFSIELHEDQTERNL